MQTIEIDPFEDSSLSLNAEDLEVSFLPAPDDSAENEEQANLTVTFQTQEEYDLFLVQVSYFK